jgi:hypothetical protein
MAHQVIGDKVVVDWKTGDPEGDRLTLLGAYRDFIKEIQEVLNKYGGQSQCSDAIVDTFQKWGIDAENQIDDVPRIWIKRPQAG